MNVLWLKIIRVTTIFYDSRKTRYPAIDPKLTVIQILLSVVAMAFSILNVRILYFGSGYLIRSSFIEDVVFGQSDLSEDYDPPDYSPRTRTALTAVFQTTNCLIAYTVLAQL